MFVLVYTHWRLGVVIEDRDEAEEMKRNDEKHERDSEGSIVVSTADIAVSLKL